MPAHKRKDRELDWRGVFERQSASGLNVASFCRQESLSAASFYAWRRKLKTPDAPSAKADARSAAGTNFATQLLPVRIESGSPVESVRIFLPRGISIEASGGVDRGALVDLAAALREAQRC